MSLPEATLRWQRWAVVAVLVGSALVVLPAAVEPFMLPKVTWVVMGGVALGALSMTRAVATRRLSIPTSTATAAAGLLGLALLIATITSSAPATSLVGFYGRYSGLVPYLAYLVLFAVVLCVLDLGFVRMLTRAGLVALGAVVLYGLLQAAGADPVDYGDNGLGRTFSFLGNVNFSGAWAGATASLCLVTALASDEHRAWRAYAAALLPLTLLYTVLTGTSQGPLIALASLGTAGLVLALAPDSPVRAAARRRRRLVVGGVAGSVAVVALAVAASLPFLRAQLDQSLVERPDFWAAAIDIFRDHPVLGTGLDTYAHFFLAYRPADHALAYGPATTDAPHSVPLAMLTNGGLVLGAVYLAFVVVIGVAVTTGARRAGAEQRPGLAAFGGVWVGFQLQSLVSFDVPPLAVLHFLSAAVVLGLTRPPTWRSIALPGATIIPVKPGRKGRQVRPAPLPTATRALVVLVSLLTLGSLWLVLRPLRADLVAASAAPLTQQGRYEEAARRFREAADLNPSEASYAFLAAQASAASGDAAAALEQAGEAADRDPGTVQYALFAARTSRELGDLDTASSWYRESVQRDPVDPPVLNEAGAFFLAAGQAGEAVEVLERSVRLQPTADAMQLLDQARSTSGA